MRILSDSGHLCNEDCAHLLTRLVTPRTRSIFLAHLSEEANQPQLAWQVSADALKQCACRKDLVLKAAGQYEILMGGCRYEERLDSAYRPVGVLELSSDR